MNAQGKFFYGWAVALASGFGIACGIAVFIPSTLGLLVGPLTSELGWAQPQVFQAPLWATTTTILIAPLLGRIVDRLGARRIIVVSVLIEAVIVASFYYINGNPLLFYLRYAALAAFATGTTAVAFAKIISNWFDRRRGTALGLALAGTGIGGVLWTLATQHLFDLVGWRLAFPLLAAFLVVVVAPLMVWVIRDRPSDCGLEVDGGATGAERPRAIELAGLSMGQACRTLQYWLLAGVAFLVGFGVQALMLHLVPILKEAGYSSQVAADAQASLWMALVVGRLSTGWLMDRFFAPRIAALFLLFPMLAIALLVSGGGAGGFAAAMLVGLAAGAEVDVIAFLVARYFGLRHYGTIYATFFSAFAFGSGIGPLLVSQLHERSGHYAPALYAIGGVLLLAALLLLTCRRFPRERDTAVNDLLQQHSPVALGGSK